MLLMLCAILVTLIVVLVKLQTPSGLQNVSATDDPPVFSDDARLPKDVVISGVPVGGYPVGQVRAALEAQLSGRLSAVAVTVQTDFFTETLNAQQLGAHYDIDAVLRQALAGKKGKSYEAVLTVDLLILAQSVQELQKEVPNAAVDAKAEILYKPETRQPYWSYTEGQRGMTIHIEELEKAIKDNFAGGITSFSVTPEMTVSEPNITVAMLQAERTQLNTNMTGQHNAPMLTEYKYRKTSSTTEAQHENNAARDVNILKAVNEKIQNVIFLPPGEVFSFNNTTGKRSEKNGWAMANAIQDFTYVKEPGGGVCQVTTTLFNALITSGVEITFRKPHSIPSDYVPVGRDATVDYGTIDFTFRNNTGANLWVFVYVRPQDTSAGGSAYKKNICVEVYGRALPAGQEYRIRMEEVEPPQTPDVPIIKEDINMPVGTFVVTKPGHTYYNTVCHVDLYENGQFVRTVAKYASIYKGNREERTVGIMTPSPKPTATPKSTPTPTPADWP